MDQKYIVHFKVKSKWHEETSSNEWELGNDRTCQKNRHRPVLVRTNRVYLAGKACEGEPKSSLCQGNCLYMEECNTKTQIKNIKKLFLLFCTHPLHPIYIDLVVSTWFIAHMENIWSSNLAKCYWGLPSTSKSSSGIEGVVSTSGSNLEMVRTEAERLPKFLEETNVDRKSS